MLNSLQNQTKSTKILSGKIKNESGKEIYLKSNVEPLRKKLVQPTNDAILQINTNNQEIREIDALKKSIQGQINKELMIADSLKKIIRRLNFEKSDTIL